jgi:APA family basic amino acid/polyamine antiporter
MPGETQSLKRVLGRTDILTFAFGTMVGWGWVILSGLWIQQAGVIGALIAFFIGAVLCILVGLTYAELTAALPLAGGELVFAYRAMGDGTARFVGWVASFTYIGVAAWEGIAIATALDYMFPIPKLGYLWDVAGYSVYASWAAIGSIGALIIIEIIRARPICRNGRFISSAD